MEDVHELFVLMYKNSYCFQNNYKLLLLHYFDVLLCYLMKAYLVNTVKEKKINHLLISRVISLSVSKKKSSYWIARSSLSSSCKNFNAFHYLKNIKLIMMRCSCKTRGITLKAIFLEF